MNVTDTGFHSLIKTGDFSSDEESDSDNAFFPLAKSDKSSGHIISHRNIHLASLDKVVRPKTSIAKQMYVFGRKVTPIISIASKVALGLYLSAHIALPWVKKICDDPSNLSQESALLCRNFELFNPMARMLVYSSCIVSVSLAFRCSKAIINRSIKTAVNVSNFVSNMGKKIHQYFYPTPRYSDSGKTFFDYLPPKPLREKTHFEKFEDHISYIRRGELEEEAKQLYAFIHSKPLGRAIPANEIDPELLFWRQAYIDARASRLKRKMKKAT